MRSVLVTGGTTRLGRAIADYLGKTGWRVLTSSHRADAGADIVADLSEPMGAARLYAQALRILDGQPPDALVNNAALFVGSEAELEAVNVTAPKKLIMLMAGRETGRGSVVNILDARVLSSCPPAGVYTRTKKELLDYTHTGAEMFIATLRVNAVAPGPVLPPTQIHEKAGETPLGRPGTEDVARAVAFLLEAETTTGAVIPVDGGQSIL